MRKILIVLGLLGVIAVLGLVVGVRLVGPRLISVAPPRGVPLGQFDTPRPENSRLGLHLVAPLSLLDEIANAEVPETFQGSEVRDFHKRIRNGSYTWEVTRGEIHFHNEGDELSFSAPFEGRAGLKGELDAAVLTLPFEGTAEVAGVAGGRLTPEVLPDWNVDPHLVPEIELGKAALQLGPLGSVDVGEFLGGSLGQFLQKEARKVTPALRRSLHLRREVLKLWNESHLVEKVSEDPALWLRVTPRQFLMGPIDYGTPEEVSLAVAIEAETFLGNRPPSAPSRVPLPELKPLQGTAQTDLRLPLVLGMNELNEVLAGQSFDLDTGLGTKLRIHGLAAEVGQGGLLNLRLDLEADRSRLGRGVAGSIWVKGKPVIDYEQQTLGFTSIELTVETRDKLTHAANWLLGNLLVSALEARLRIDLDDYQAELDEEVQKAIAGAKLPPGIEVSLKGLDVGLLDVYTVTRHLPEGDPDPGLVFVIQAKGDLSTRIHRLDLKRTDIP